MDRLIGGSMKRSLEMGAYPVAVGSHQIFINTRPESRARTLHAASEGRHRRRPRRGGRAAGGGPRADRPSGGRSPGRSGWRRAGSTRRRISNWPRRCSEAAERGIGAGDAARLVAQGVYKANALLGGGRDDGRKWPRVSHLRFVELYLDRATDAWRALRLQAAATPGRFDDHRTVRPGTGALPRPPDSGYRGAEFDFITVETKRREGRHLVDFLHARHAASPQRSSRPARTEPAAQRAGRDRVERSESRQQIGRTLFNLLIPVELEAYLAGSGEMQIELDPLTAKIPWELLDTQERIGRPIRRGRIRVEAAPQAADSKTSACSVRTRTPRPVRW